jgi:hypothetical protein
MADEPGIEHGVEIGAPVRSLLGEATEPGPIGGRPPRLTCGIASGRWRGCGHVSSLPRAPGATGGRRARPAGPAGPHRRRTERGFR